MTALTRSSYWRAIQPYFPPVEWVSPPAAGWGRPGAKLVKGPREAVLSLPLPAAPGASKVIPEIMPP